MFIFLVSCWYFGSIHSVERAYTKQDLETLQKHLEHPHQRYMREQSALFLSNIPLKNIEVHQQQELIAILKNCVQNNDEFDDVRASCSVTLSHWKIEEAAIDIINASKSMQKEPLFWMCYALANIQTPTALEYLPHQDTQDLLIRQGLQDWLQTKDPNLEFIQIFQGYMEEER